MAKRSLASISLRWLMLSVTAICVFLAIAVVVYEQRYGRNYRAHHFFKSVDGMRVIVGDACPEEFIYSFDGKRREEGLPLTVTPDFIDSLTGLPLSYPAVRELHFRVGRYTEVGNFQPEMVDQIVRLAPELEYIDLPNIDKIPEKERSQATDEMISKLVQLKKVRHLSFLRWPIADRHIEKISRMDSIQVLQIMSPQEGGITARSLEYCRQMRNLRQLQLQRTSIQVAEMQKFHNDRPEVLGFIDGNWYGDKMQLYLFRKVLKDEPK